jgi:RNA polymerase sigma factor (sigma-70 family)
LKRADWDEFVQAPQDAATALPDDKARLCRLRDRLRDKLVRDNMGLVKKFVMRLHKASSAYAEVEDLMQAGAIGLVRTLDGYDPNKGAFSTFAAWWIRHEVQNATAKVSQITRPKNSGVPLSVALEIDRFRQLHGRAPRPEELTPLNGQPVTQRDLDQWMAFPLLTSIDETFGNAGREEGSSTLSKHETISNGAPTIEALLVDRERALKIMACLTPSEREIVQLLHLDGVMQKTVAESLGVSRARVTQINAEAIAKLRKAMGRVDRTSSIPPSSEVH